MNKILVALDFSDLTGAVLQQTVTMARALGATVRLIHTEPPATGYIYEDASLGLEAPLVGFGCTPCLDEQVRSRELEHDRQALDTIREQLEREGVTADTVLLEGPTPESIVAQAETYGADLIIVGIHKHGRLYSLLFGNTAMDIMPEAPCPLLLVPETRKTEDS
jgi:nucleotide-binding universal stress UspA family protein